MRRYIIFVAMSLIIFINCEDKNTQVNKTQSYFDATTMATPQGGRLKAADEGPVRSALGQPKIDVDSFNLVITGLVDPTISISFNQLKDIKSFTTDTMIMYCVEGWEVWGTWKGVLISDILIKTNLSDRADHILFHCADGYTTALPIAYLIKYDAMVAYEVNGNPLKNYDGFPLRLVAFGKFGYKWAKWVTKLEIIENTLLGYWENYGYTDRADVPINRRRYYEGPDAKELSY